VKGRFVSEEYQSATFPNRAKVDGSHAGVYLMYYFN
jgi:hypothetical protein